MEYRLSELPGGGVAATDATVKELARLCRFDLQKSPALRFSATSILRDARVPGKDVVGEARALFEWVRANVRYQKDPVDIETVQSPIVTLRVRAGDCDDQAALLAALAMAVGIPARFRVIGLSTDRFIHIVPELFAGGRWWWADTTERGAFGQRPARRFPVERVYSFSGEVVNMAGAVNVYPVTQGQLKTMVKRAVWETLTKNWKSGLIDEADLRGYLNVISEGNFYTQKPLLKDPTREAIEKFLKWAPANLGPSKKYGSGLSGVSGFLSTIAKAVGSVVGAVVPGAGGVITSLTQTGQTVAAAGIEPFLNDLEAAVNSADGRGLEHVGYRQFGLSEIIAYMRKWGLGWLPITSANSFLNPPTLPMYLQIASGQLSMDADSLVPFTGTPQNEAKGAAAVNEIVKQFGASSPLLSQGAFYKVRGGTVTSGGSVTSAVQSAFTSPWVLGGLGLLAVMFLFGGGKRARSFA